MSVTYSWKSSLWMCLVAASLLAGCATTVADSKKVNNLLVAPQSVTFVWSAAKPPARSSLPALGAALPGSPFWAAYPVEYLSFAENLRPLLEAQESLHPAFVVLPSEHSQAQLDAVLRQVRKGSAVVLMYPEAVASYCSDGCYAFKVRVNYLSAAQRKLVWTGRIELPPKANHRDSFAPLAKEFSSVLLRQLSEQQLLPR